METPGTPCPFCASANIQAAKTIRPGLANSDGCRLNGPRLIQRAAPLASLPMNGSGIMTMMAQMRASTAMRRTPRGDSSEATSMAPPAGAREDDHAPGEVEGVGDGLIGPDRRRAGGEGQRHAQRTSGSRRRPAGRWSTVHHHWAMGEVSLREKAWA